jgi:SAM-dependent methyltransferase
MRPVANFDRLARAYRWLEWFSFGPMLQRTRVHFLDELSSCRNALVLGDGDGRFTARLLESNPLIQIKAVDASGAMLSALLRHSDLRQDRVAIQKSDIRVWQPDPQARYDLIVTHFFLDCLDTGEIAQLAAAIKPVLAEDAIWIVSEFAIPAKFLPSFIAKILVKLLYLSFNWMTNLRLTHLPDHHAALKKSGWQLSAQNARLGGLLVSQLWSYSSVPAVFTDL